MKKFLLSLCVLLCCAVASHAQIENEYPDVPLDDSAYADIAVLGINVVISGECYFGGPRNPARTPYEFAVTIARWLENSAQGANVYQPENAAVLKRLLNKFLPELKAMRVDVEKIKINGVFLIEPKIASVKTKVAPPFSDVPKNHWAFEAVEKLRQSGIVVGYSDGAFVGSD